MSLAETSIRRPVMTIVFSIVIIVFGLIGFTGLGVREYPAVDPPVVTVSTSYAGASADVIESQITEPLEASINGIGGVKALTSTSREGRSQITVEFEIGTDLEAAANDVRDRVSRSLRNLPTDADPPTVAKADADANPIIFLTIGSATRDPLSLNDVASNFIKERLQTIKGISEISVFGEKKYAMRISLDPARMDAYQITLQDVRNAVNSGNVELPSGKIEGTATELTVRTEGRLATAEEFNNLTIREVNGRVIKLRDIGKAQLTAENLRNSLRRDGVPLVGLGVLPQPGENNVAIADAVYERLEEMKPDLPKDITIGTAFDVTVGIRHSIDEVIETIAIAFGLVVIIIFLFLRDWRTTLIPTLAIPVSLIGVFAIMAVAGFSINILTLLGIVLAIGLVVDDAIVVLENIYAKIEEGMPPLEAAFTGVREIVVAVVATTIVLVAVFLPLLFLQGLTGRLFMEFGVVIAGSVLISAFVALTLTPMLSGRLLKGKSTGWFYRVTEPFFEKVTHSYRASLETFMRHRWLAFPIMVAAGALIYIAGGALQSELAPLEDKGRIRISATAQEGATYKYMNGVIHDLAEIVAKATPEREGVMEIVGGGGSSGSNNGSINLLLKERDARGEGARTQQQIAQALSKQFAGISAARVSASQEPTIGDRRAGLPVQFVLQTSTLEKLRTVLPKFMEEAGRDPTFSFVDVNLKFNRPELRIDIDREKAEALGVSALDVAQTLQLALSEGRIAYFIREGKQYQVIGQLDQGERTSPLDLRSLSVRSRSGQLVRLDNLVTMKEESSPPQLFRYNRSVSATVSANLSPGRTIGDGIAAMEAIADKTLDASFTTELAGSSRDFAESSSTILFAFLLALLLVYLILAAQFESFRDPFIILLTVPLALAGAVLSLWYFGQTLNIFSQIGIIMLVGLVTKNGILIVEFGNQRKEQGLRVRDAVIDAAEARFRPIVMTSLATMLGALPIALALGAGAQSRVSMGIVIIGGLLFSAGLTLYVIPAIYSYLSREHAHDPAPSSTPPAEAPPVVPVHNGEMIPQVGIGE